MRRHARVIKVAPVTRAIRSALAVSATTLALTASGGVLAGTLAIPATTAIHHDIARRDAFQPVIDLTVVRDDFAPTSVHAASGSDAWSGVATHSGIVQHDGDVVSVAPTLGDVADPAMVRAGMSGPGGVSGSDDFVLYNFDDPANTGLAYGTFLPYAANSNYGIADVVFAGVGSVAHLVNYDTLTATGSTWAAGFEVEAVDYAHDVRNAAGATINASTDGVMGQAWGIYAVSGNDTRVYNDGTIYASSTGIYGTATGLYGGSTNGNAYARNTGTINASASGAATGVDVVAYGDASVHNSGSITANAIGKYANATGMHAYSATGIAYLDNTGDITVSSFEGNAIGMYGYSVGGNVDVANTAGISATSLAGLADGIFASGLYVDVTNDGGITATGGTWAAGVEAQGSATTTVTNTGGILAQANGLYGQAFGIYATSGTGGATVTNSGGITALGDYASGIQVSSDGDVAISNTGGISAGDSSSYLSAGIYATTNYEGADITVVNDGSVTAVSIYGSSGIDVSAAGTGSSASVTNSGGVVAVAYSNLGYGATGILVAADADAGITTTGAVGAYTNGTAYGAMALASSGDASIVASGSITANGYYAFGAVAASSYGTASIDNSATVHADAGYIGQGLVAEGVAGATISNSGYVEASAGFAYGAFAKAGDGGASITNTGYGEIVVDGYVGIGMIGLSTNGDVTIDNAGLIRSSGYAQGVGTFALSYYGDATTRNAGEIYAVSYNTAVGMFARADYGTAYIYNQGLSVGVSNDGEGTGARVSGSAAEVTNVGLLMGVTSNGNLATGIDAFGDNSVTVTNLGLAGGIAKYSGDAHGVSAFSYGDALVSNGGDAQIAAVAKYGNAYGISVQSIGGDAIVDNAGAITAYAGDVGYSQPPALRAGSRAGNYAAFGIVAVSANGDGDVQVTNTGDILVASYENAFGVIGASSTGDVDIDSSAGSIKVSAVYGVAVGMSGYSDSGTAKVSNGGDLNVYSYAYSAIGLSSGTGSGDAVADNSGSIYAGSYWGDAIGVSGYSEAGNVSLTNSGSIETYSYAGAAIGMYGYASAGDVNIDVTGGSISAYSYYGLADGIFASGATVEVANAGSIYANGYGWAAGIEAQAADTVSVGNTGDISVVSYFGSHGYGVFATGGAGGATVDNGGTIEVVGSYVTGIYASAGGDIAIDNSGSINAGSADSIQYTYLATGIRAVTNFDDSNIVVTSSGDIAAYGYYGARGIDAEAAGAGSSASVTSGGNIYAQQVAKYGYGAFGIIASGDKDASIVNAGSITTVSGGISYGAVALAFSGNASVTNSGDIAASTTAASYYSAIGVLASSANGTASAVNSGGITTTASYYVGTGMQVEGNTGAIATNSGSISTDALVAYGIHAASGQGDVMVDNQAGGGVQANSDYGFALGIYGSSSAGDVLIANEGTIESVAYRGAYGVFATADAGDVSVDSSGTILAYSPGMANGIYAVAAAGDVMVANEGGIQAISLGDNAYGVMAVANAGDVAISNAGSIYANSQVSDAIGAWALAGQGTAVVANGGSIDASTAYAGGSAAGVLVQGYAGAQVSNGGLISAESVPGASAIGVVAQADGNVLVSNSGEINATDSDYAVAVQADSANGIATIVNSGILRTFSTREGQVAVSGGDGVQKIANYGDIYGAIITAGGDDVMFNGDAGVWHVTNHSTDFGAGDDVITNAGAGTIVLADGAIHLGASGSTGNAFTNYGRVWVRGRGLIDMGSAATLAAGANALPLTNNGVLDMVDGATDDALTIAGDLAGSGSVDVDIAPLINHADQLYVDGSVTGSQSVDINLVGVPLSGHIDPIAFAHVTGDSTADSFIGGHVVGYDESSFLDMQVNVISQIDTSNASDDIFSVGLDVLGLNSAGSLGATVATVAHGVMASQIGTWRQRMGVIAPKRDDQVGLSPWIRVFGDSGSVKLAHHETNFGGSGTFGFDQSNNGRELGMNVNIRSDLNIGLLAAKTTGTQHLTGAGVGSDHLDSTAFGMYATWIAPQFYLDASYRWLDFDAHFRSAAGLQGTRGNGGAFNVEAGYTAWTFAGIAVTPQLQYTRSHVGDFSTIHGAGIDFVANGGASTRGRAGVEFSKVMEGAGWVWTPYGSVNAIREFDGEANYAVGDDFTGFTSAKGTSAMVELGVGARKDGFSVTGGANWTDGGAYQGVLGGQVVVRYSW
jgi:hypothetical protein